MVDLSSGGNGHTISLVNPEISVVKNSQLTFGVAVVTPSESEIVNSLWTNILLTKLAQ